MKSIRKNYFLNIISQLLRIVTPFITTPYVSRVLGVDNIGAFSYYYSIQYYFCLFAVLGTAEYGSREIARNRDDRNKTSVSFWELELLTFFTSVIMLIGWGTVIFFNPVNRVLFLILTTYLLAAMFDITWFYSGLELFPNIVARNVCVRITEVCLIFLLVRSHDDLPVYCAIMGGGTLLCNISLWIGIGKYVDLLDFKQLKPFRHLQGTLIFFLPSIATTLYTVVDKTLIGVITRSTYENGCYEQATKVVSIAKAVTISSLNAVLSPRSSYLFAKGEIERIKGNLLLSLDIMFVLGFGFVFGIIATSDRFVPAFFGSGYDKVALLLKLLSPIIVVIIVSYSLGSQYYNPAGLRLKSCKYLFVGALCNILMNLLLIPFFKSAGAIVSSLIAEFVIALLYLKNCDGYLHFTNIISLSYKKIVSGFLMFIVIAMTPVFTGEKLIDLIVSAGIGVVLYFVSLVVLRDSCILYIAKQVFRLNNG